MVDSMYLKERLDYIENITMKPMEWLKNEVLKKEVKKDGEFGIIRKDQKKSTSI